MTSASTVVRRGLRAETARLNYTREEKKNRTEVATRLRIYLRFTFRCRRSEGLSGERAGELV